MAETTSKTEDSAEKANAAASEPAKSAAKPVEAKSEGKPAAAKKASVKKAAPAKKAAPKKAAAKKAAPAKKPVAAKTPAPKRAKAPAARIAKATKTQPSVTQLKEKIMATKNFDYTAQISESMTEAVNEMQARTQAAYDKSTEAMTEMTEFAKGNVEAVVESGKLFAEGVQSMGQTFADEAKTAYETATADIKEMAGVKSPTELFQLQGKIMRRNFDAMIAATSKNTDATMKLANDVVAPITGRVNVATEKMSKVG